MYALFNNIDLIRTNCFFYLINQCELRYDETYTYLGVLNGRFYSSKGEKTELLLNLEKILEKQKVHERINSEFNARFPTCNRYI